MLILISSLGYLFKTKKGNYIHLLIWSVIITIMNTINVVYYTFFSTFASFSLLATLKQASTQGAAIFNKISPDNVIYILFFITFIVFARKINKKGEKSMEAKLAAEIIDSGKALEALDNFIKESNI